MIEELDEFHLILINSNVSSHMQLVAITVQSTVLSNWVSFLIKINYPRDSYVCIAQDSY